MRSSKLEGGTRSLAAAPFGPDTRPRLPASASSMICRSRLASSSASVGSGCCGKLTRPESLGNQAASTQNTALAQWRQHDRKYIETVVQVTAEFVSCDHLGKIAMGRRHQTDVDAVRAAASQTLKLPLLQDAQQLRLQSLRLAQMTAPIARMRVVEPPREIKTFPYFMAWHPRLTTEPAHAWFREQLRMAARTA